ncbi:hypothetical protein HNQ59_000498 [Chitinivorax tropicus]|uniref:Uncharacterized protein n=1 Tax=Chitinivorax tropicus TaxID=714531 RepID=A0A840ML03_9PROT|nr:hypothetical protein [Chitinivorax tropicus]MBB5017236.1 hypothetical protein [Chitinivorax tropicus]
MFYHSPQTGTNSGAIKLALRKGYSLSSEVCIAVGELRDLDGSISEVLGERAIKFLKKDRKAQYFGKTIKLLTPKADPGPIFGPLIAAFVPLPILEAWATQYPKLHIIYLPPDDASLAAYQAQYQSMSI